MLLAEIDTEGNLIVSYTRADTLISQTRKGVTSTYLYDGHGDVRALLNDAGRITDKYRYTAYGDLIEQSGDTENHFRYTGEYYDGVSGFILGTAKARILHWFWRRGRQRTVPCLLLDGLRIY